MNNEYYGAPTTSSEDFLAHYGIKGMKWGVRKAVASGNAKRLGRQFRKAEKKLAKLERRATSGKKYAKRAAALGLGAAAAGGLAAAGTEGIANAMKVSRNAVGSATHNVGKFVHRVGSASGKPNVVSKVGLGMMDAGQHISNNKAIGKAAKAVSKWGKGTSISDAVQGGVGKVASKFDTNTASKIMKASPKTHSNNTYTRVGAAALGAGLAAGAGYNAYRAATTKRAAKKAARFKSEMNKAFAGTQYAGKAGTTGGKKPRKKRR